MRLIQKCLDLLAGLAEGNQIDQHQMIVRSAGDDIHTAIHQTLCQCLRVALDLHHVFLERRLQGFLKADSLGRDDVHQRTSLDAGEDGFVEVEAVIDLIRGQDQTAARSAECLVCRRSRHMRIGDRRWMQASRD